MYYTMLLNQVGYCVCTSSTYTTIICIVCIVSSLKIIDIVFIQIYFKIVSKVKMKNNSK